MLVSLSDVLSDAVKKTYAIGAFNVYNYETIKGCFLAANEQASPIIIAFGSNIPYMDIDDLYILVSEMATTVPFPVALHLDHCKNKETIEKAINTGFSSVMYDGSLLPFEENIANTKEIVALAHAKGVQVEAELGSLATGMGTNERELSNKELYTDPGQAQAFVERTNVDALAVSIGTVHGLHRGKQNIRFDILSDIHTQLSDFPLVLHGGSGVSAAEISHCIQSGISKINVNTEISRSVTKQIKDMLEKDPDIHYSSLSATAIKVVADVVGSYIRIFQNA
ncbi:MAG: class II fructose-bisphosphate aldolase [Spirochaetia bacterium]|jgi:fructose-bisphosphate aldolase class II|nr:class II fructose-bisphosphate aldolase [Spirochaetia bacterium]